MRPRSEGNVKVKGGFREISLFPSTSRSFLEVQAAVHTASTKTNIGRKSFLVFILFEWTPHPLLSCPGEKGEVIDDSIDQKLLLFCEQLFQFGSRDRTFFQDVFPAFLVCHFEELLFFWR